MPQGAGAFPWSRAVQGLSLLCVQSVQARLADQGEKFLSGSAGSLAAALDSAISKQPDWVFQMFGSDPQGSSLLRRMVVRINPERKRSGPVEIALKANLVAAIEIHLNGSLCNDIESLQHLGQMLEDKSHGAVFQLPHSRRPTAPNHFLFDLVKREVLSGLLDTTIFSANSTKHLMASLANYAPFQKIGGQPSLVSGEFEVDLSDSARLGLGLPDHLMSKQLRTNSPIRLLCGVGGVTSLCIFKYLTDIKNYNLEVSYDFSSSQDISYTLRSQGSDAIDGVIMALCCSVRLCQGKSSFSPLTIMPITTNTQLSKGTDDFEPYLLLGDSPTGSHFYLENSRETLQYCPRVESLPFAGLVDELARYSSGRAILFWPYYTFADGQHGWNRDSTFKRNVAYELSTLCVSDRITKNPQLALALNVAIRDAWLALRTNPQLLDQMIEALINDPRFVSAFLRLGTPILKSA